jgi:MFS family permease
LFGSGVAGTLGAMNPAASVSTRAAWAALPVLLAGAFMVVLDFFIVNVALPSIATELGAGNSSLEWVVAGYGLTFAAFLITAGRLGDDLGRRRVYVVGVALFTAARRPAGSHPARRRWWRRDSRRESPAPS